MTDTLVESYYRIRPERFHYLKFILEGYDNLAVLSSADPHGLIRVRCFAGSLREVVTLLTTLAPELKKASLA